MTAVWGAEDTSYESKKLAPIENGLKKLLDLLPGFTFIMCKRYLTFDEHNQTFWNL